MLYRYAYLLAVIGGGCLLIAALSVAFTGVKIGPAWAWAFGGFASWCLAWAGASAPRPPPPAA
jgi:hypothetical protein